jgi:hypothetical protein
MLIHLHKKATTTPKVRAAIQASDDAGMALAERFGGAEDQKTIQWIVFPTNAQEAVAVALRKTLLVSLDDLLAVVREFLNPNASRSGLDRCLRRHGVGNLRDLTAKAAKPKHSAFKA